MSHIFNPVGALQTVTEATASATAQISAAFPSPPTDGIDLVGPLRIGFYGLAIGLGILVAYFVASRLWKSRGGSPENVFDALIWAVLLGIVGGRLYHAITRAPIRVAAVAPPAPQRSFCLRAVLASAAQCALSTASRPCRLWSTFFALLMGSPQKPFGPRQE